MKGEGTDVFYHQLISGRVHVSTSLVHDTLLLSSDICTSIQMIRRERIGRL